MKRNNSKKKKHEGIKTGTYVTIYNGSEGVVIHSTRSETCIRELKYKNFDSEVCMPTSQARTLIKRAK